jgi:hypothetical protein
MVNRKFCDPHHSSAIFSGYCVQCGEQTMEGTMGSPAATSTAPRSAAAHPAPARGPVIRDIWPAATIAFGLALTLAWACLLGYGLFFLIKLAL